MNKTLSILLYFIIFSTRILGLKINEPVSYKDTVNNDDKIDVSNNNIDYYICNENYESLSLEDYLQKLVNEENMYHDFVDKYYDAINEIISMHGIQNTNIKIDYINDVDSTFCLYVTLDLSELTEIERSEWSNHIIEEIYLSTGIPMNQIVTK